MARQDATRGGSRRGGHHFRTVTLPVNEHLITDQAAREQYVRLNDGGLIPAELKDAALYVDLLADGTLRVPRTAAKAMIYAEMHLKLLSGYLRPFAALPDVLTDDGEWNSFAGGVRHPIEGAGG